MIIMAEGKVLSDYYYASFVIWHSMLGYKEISCPEDECNRDAHVSLDVR